MYAEMLARGHDPYLHWNKADQIMQNALRDLVPEGLREHVLAQSAAFLWAAKQASTPVSTYEFEPIGTEEEEEQKDEAYTEEIRQREHEYTSQTLSQPILRGSEQMQSSALGHPKEEAHGGKRKRREEHGMEPAGHGNTPATGTEQAGYIAKYLPVNFPDKFTIKERYVNVYDMRSITTMASVATPAVIGWRMNSCFAPEAYASANALSAYGHRPNQRANWATQYGYYRVESVSYKLTCVNSSASAVATTQNPPGTFNGNQSISDAVLTLMETQTASDMTNTSQISMWEQKDAQNVVLLSRLAGHDKATHVYKGVVNPEDYDIDPLTTAADETWTAVGANPATVKNMYLAVQPLNPTNTVALLPEVGVLVYAEFYFTVQYAGYVPGLRQVTS